MLFNPKDNVGIILKGAENEEEANNDFEGIKIHRKLDFPTIKLFDDLDRIEANEDDTQGDCKI